MEREEVMRRVAEGDRLHEEGYSCSQCVLMACAPELGIDAHTAAVVGSGLGAGMAVGETCGVVSAMAIAEGLKRGNAAAGGKLEVMPKVRRLCNEFAGRHGGKLACRDLKGKCGCTCGELIADGIRMVLAD